MVLDYQVIAFNGNPVTNLKTLASMVESCNDEFMKFNLDYDQVSLSVFAFISFLLVAVALALAHNLVTLQPFISETSY